MSKQFLNVSYAGTGILWSLWRCFARLLVAYLCCLTLYAPTFPKWEHFLKLCNSQISMKMCIFIVCMCYTDTSPYYLRFYLRKFPFFLFKKWVQKSEIHQNYFLISFLLVNLNFRSNFKFDP